MLDGGQGAVSVFAVGIALTTVAILSVLLRLYSKRIKGSVLVADDYLIVLGLISAIGNSVTYIIGAASEGLNLHIEAISLPQLIGLGKVLFATQFLYIGAVTCIKLSILAFYRQVFPAKRFLLVTNVVGLFLILWFITFSFATMFQAWPLSYNWEDTNNGTEINELGMYNAAAATELFIDLVLLVMPWPVIWSLQMTTSRKLTITGIFMLGGFVCISGAVRLYYYGSFYDPGSAARTDFTYYVTPLCLWSTIEPCCGVICACLPTLGPILTSSSLLTGSWGQALLSYMSWTRRRSSAGVLDQSLPTSANSGERMRKNSWGRKKSKNGSLWSSSSTVDNEKHVALTQHMNVRSDGDCYSPTSNGRLNIVEINPKESEDIYSAEGVREVPTIRDDIETGPGFIGTRNGSLLS